MLSHRATLRDLDSVDWHALELAWSGGRHDWKHLRGFVSRFLTCILADVHHPFRRKIMEKIPRAGRIPGRVPDLTPAKFWEIVRAMPEHVRAAPVAIVATGMRIGEFCATQETDLRPLTRGVRIPGTKTDDSEAVQPVHPELWLWLERAIPCLVGHWRLRELWRRACRKVGVSGLTLHDLRHCYGQWLVNAGRPEEAVQRGLRHRTAEMTRRYVMQSDRQENAQVIGAILLESHGLTQRGKGHGAQTA